MLAIDFQREIKRCASAASFGQVVCFPNAPPAIGFSLLSSTNLSCSSQVIVSRQHGMARAPNPYQLYPMSLHDPYRKQQSPEDFSKNETWYNEKFSNNDCLQD